MLQLIWSHGWGFNATFFMPLIRALPEHEHFIINWGYFDDSPFTYPKPDLSRSLIGIGHSLGFAKLFDLPFSYERVISLGGFTCFCQSDSFAIGTPVRILQRMFNRFQSHPQQVLQDFYVSCGFNQPYLHPTSLNLERLSKDLELLMRVDISIPTIAYLALSGGDDQICSLPQQKAMFNPLQIVEGAHNFPVVNYLETASLINQFLA